MDKDRKSNDQSKRFDQQEAQEKHRRQAGTQGSGTKREQGEFSQQQAEEKHRRQAGQEQQGGFRSQQQAEHTPTRQQGGWSDKDMRQEGRKPAMERDRDYDPDGDKNNR